MSRLWFTRRFILLALVLALTEVAVGRSAGSTVAGALVAVCIGLVLDASCFVRVLTALAIATALALVWALTAVALELSSTRLYGGVAFLLLMFTLFVLVGPMGEKLRERQDRMWRRLNRRRFTSAGQRAGRADGRRR